VKIFKCNSEKILLDSAANQQKWQHCPYLMVQVHYI